MLKKKIKLSPIMTCIVLIFCTVLLSGFLHFINVQSEYSTVNTATNELNNNIVQVNSLFSFSGIKHVVLTAVSGFVNFAPLSMLIIVLIGIGILEKSGFLKTFFTLLTRHAKKYSLTFTLILLCLLLSFLGDLGYVVLLPLGALLFKYGRRNPLGGIIASFAALSFGKGINLFLSTTDTSLVAITLKASRMIDPKYSIGVFFQLFIMLVVMIAIAIAFTIITEKRIMPRLPRNEIANEEEFVITKKELRGLIIGIAVGLLYILIVAYMIIPGLPLSGALLDSSAIKYTDKLLGPNSLFSQGYIFIMTMLFVVVGLGYGFMTKSIRNNKDVTESLGYSLDGIGNVLVLIFFASLLINIFDKSNIGVVLTAGISNIISSISFSGLGLIIVSFVLIAISNIFCPSLISKWGILSAVMVPLFMNNSISPEYAQVVYTAGCSVTAGITPLMIYFVIYVAFMEKYNKDEEMVTLFGSIRYMLPYAYTTFLIWFAVLLGWYLLGAPIGIGSLPGVTYGA